MLESEPKDHPSPVGGLEPSLVDRLYGPHEWGYRCPVEGGFIKDDTPFDAACTISSLEADVDRAETNQAIWVQIAEDRQAENERLREALNSISGLSNAGNFSISIDAARGILQRVEAIADQALREQHD